MDELFATGRIADLILGLLALEVLLLGAYHRWTGRGVAPANLLANFLAGAFLLVALRGALTGTGWGWIGLSLGLALVAHVADLRRRWRTIPDSFRLRSGGPEPR